MNHGRGSPPTSARCARNSTRSTIASPKGPRPTAGGASPRSRPAPQDVFHDADERLVHAGPGLRARVRPRPAALPEERFDVRRREGALPLEVRLVHHAVRRDVARDGTDGPRPFIERDERVASGEVRHREDPLRAVVIRLFQQLADRRRAHDVPQDHVGLERFRARRIRDGQALLRDLRAQGRDVSVVVLVEHVSPDERGLADRAFPGHADLEFDDFEGHLHLSISSARRRADCSAAASPCIPWSFALNRQAPGYRGSMRSTWSRIVTRPSQSTNAAPCARCIARSTAFICGKRYRGLPRETRAARMRYRPRRTAAFRPANDSSSSVAFVWNESRTKSWIATNIDATRSSSFRKSGVDPCRRCWIRTPLRCTRNTSSIVRFRSPRIGAMTIAATIATTAKENTARTDVRSLRSGGGAWTSSTHSVNFGPIERLATSS